MKFQVADRGNGPSWWLHGPDDEVLAWAGRYFATLAFAAREAAVFKSAASAVDYEVYRQPDGGWGWKAIEPVGYCMANSAENFAHPGQARRATRSIRKHVSGASGP